MKRREDLYLVDIIEAADYIALFLQDMSYAQFMVSSRDQSAVLWKLMIIGEACTRLEPNVQDRFTQIPWNQIKGFRNRLAHGYFNLAWQEVWRIATEEIPPLKLQTSQILSLDYPETYQRLVNQHDIESQ